MNNSNGTISILSLLLNPTAEGRPFQLPPPMLPGRILIDSAGPDVPAGDVTDNKVDVLGRSAVLVFSKLEGQAQ